jgi:hypothetical protein
MRKGLQKLPNRLEPSDHVVIVKDVVLVPSVGSEALVVPAGTDCMVVKDAPWLPHGNTAEHFGERLVQVRFNSPYQLLVHAKKLRLYRLSQHRPERFAS